MRFIFNRRGVTHAWALWLCLAAIAPSAAHAEWAIPTQPAPDLSHTDDELDDWGTHRFYIENDSHWCKPEHATDRYYTNGVAITIDYQPEWAKDLAGYLPFSNQFGPASVGVGYVAGQLMFTPAVYTVKRPLPNDRPFAGYLYGGIYVDRSNEQTLDHFEFNFGLVGQDSLAEATQQRVHHVINADYPAGWGNQMPDEPTFQGYIRKKWRFDLWSFTPGIASTINTENDDDADRTGLTFQALPQIGLALGTVYRFVEAGAVFRLGFNLPDDFGPGRIADLASTTTQRHSKGWTHYLFTRVTGRVVEHNLFLDGDTFRNSPVTVNHEPLVGEVEAGLGIGYRWCGLELNLTYAQTFQTKEFTTQHGTHAWGAFVFAVTVVF